MQFRKIKKKYRAEKQVEKNQKKAWTYSFLSIFFLIYLSWSKLNVSLRELMRGWAGAFAFSRYFLPWDGQFPDPYQLRRHAELPTHR